MTYLSQPFSSDSLGFSGVKAGESIQWHPSAELRRSEFDLPFTASTVWSPTGPKTSLQPEWTSARKQSLKTGSDACPLRKRIWSKKPAMRWTSGGLLAVQCPGTAQQVARHRCLEIIPPCSGYMRNQSGESRAPARRSPKIISRGGTTKFEWGWEGGLA